MKRNYIPFIAGMSTMLLLVGLVGASLAGARNRYLPALPGLRRTERRSPLC